MDIGEGVGVSLRFRYLFTLHLKTIELYGPESQSSVGVPLISTTVATSADRLVVSECDPALVLVESVMWASVAVGLESPRLG